MRGIVSSNDARLAFGWHQCEQRIDDMNALLTLTTLMRCSYWRQQCAARIDDSSELIVRIGGSSVLLARWPYLRLARQELFEVQFLDSLLILHNYIPHIYFVGS